MSSPQIPFGILLLECLGVPVKTRYVDMVLQVLLEPSTEFCGDETCGTPE